MSEKSNDPTRNRPEGERLLDAPLIRMSLPDYTRQLKSEPAWEHNDRNAITLFHNDRLRIVLVALHEGAEMPTYIVDGPSSIQALEGRIWLGTGDESLSLDTGEAVALQAQVPHHLHAETECVILLTLADSSAGSF